MKTQVLLKEAPELGNQLISWPGYVRMSTWKKNEPLPWGYLKISSQNRGAAVPCAGILSDGFQVLSTEGLVGWSYRCWTCQMSSLRCSCPALTFPLRLCVQLRIRRACCFLETKDRGTVTICLPDLGRLRPRLRWVKIPQGVLACFSCGFTKEIFLN